MTKNNLDESIIKLLSKRTFGLTIEDISGSLVINRATASKYLAVLEARGRIISRPVGKAKMHYLRTKELGRFLDG
ncbi:HTH domain-containing protein [archaeon]|nr:HTH domain-containing protein [archaeon]